MTSRVLHRVIAASVWPSPRPRPHRDQSTGPDRLPRQVAEPAPRPSYPRSARSSAAGSGAAAAGVPGCDRPPSRRSWRRRNRPAARDSPCSRHRRGRRSQERPAPGTHARPGFGDRRAPQAARCVESPPTDASARTWATRADPRAGGRQADSLARPLRRRAARMARPERVRIRRRNPWTRLRRRLLGWNVRLLTGGLPISSI